MTTSVGSEFKLMTTVSDTSACVFLELDADEEGTLVRLRGSGFPASEEGVTQLAKMLGDVSAALLSQLSFAEPTEVPPPSSSIEPRRGGFNPKPLGPQEAKK